MLLLGLLTLCSSPSLQLFAVNYYVLLLIYCEVIYPWHPVLWLLGAVTKTVTQSKLQNTSIFPKGKLTNTQRKSVITLLFKKGEVTDPNNYRPFKFNRN